MKVERLECFMPNWAHPVAEIEFADTGVDWVAATSWSIRVEGHGSSLKDDGQHALLRAPSRGQIPEKARDDIRRSVRQAAERSTEGQREARRILAWLEELEHPDLFAGAAA